MLANTEQGRPHLEVGDIFRAHGEAYRTSHALTAQERKVMRAIETCRTATLGGHVDLCQNCGATRPSYNSCRNRHCPKCQSLKQAQWIAERQERILPTHYFHVVFTVPEQLKPLAQSNRERFFALLFQAAANTLLALGKDPKRLGGQLGITAVLHTWTRDLRFHPHLHCIVTGGGLNPSGNYWIPSDRRYLFPVKVISRLFRGKLLALIEAAFARGEFPCLQLQAPKAFNRLKTLLYKKEWVVYAKTPFAGPEAVFSYLGRYTHRVAISNQRLLAMDEQGVRFITRGQKTTTLPPEQFLGRFLLHVLPPGFTKIRHFGLFAAGNVNSKLATARSLLLNRQLDNQPIAMPQALIIILLAVCLVLGTWSPPPASPPTPLTWREQLLLLSGNDPMRCTLCGGTLVRLLLPAPPPRDTS